MSRSRWAIRANRARWMSRAGGARRSFGRTHLGLGTLADFRTLLTQRGRSRSLNVGQMGQEHPPLFGSSPQGFQAPLQLDRSLPNPLLQRLVLRLEPQVQPPSLEQVSDSQERLVLVERRSEEHTSELQS